MVGFLFLILVPVSGRYVSRWAIGVPPLVERSGAQRRGTSWERDEIVLSRKGGVSRTDRRDRSVVSELR